VVFERVTPRAVMKEAFEAKLISQGQTWLDALDARNKMSHTYDFSEFDKVIQQIEKEYLVVIESFYQTLFDELMSHG
jgi:nucleotidyltransferase substrate binding protein (TIGR01987 family)